MGEIGLGTLTALPVPFLVRAIRTGSFAVLGALAGRARMAVTACNGAISAAVSVVEVGAGEEGWVALSLVLAIGVALSRLDISWSHVRTYESPCGLSRYVGRSRVGHTSSRV